ncbi:pyridoxamine 5'-phosphate oxidase family protein [Candidatus Omnitrophota bacterium]
MKRLNEGIIRFFHNQHYTIVTTIGKDGGPHTSCKGIVEIDKNGKVYLLDLYMEETYENLKRNPRISITAVDGHKFMGYSLKGIAKIVKREKLKSRTIKAWEDKITKRLSHRLLKNIRGEKGHPRHPEALLPKPEYLIAVEVKEIIDLTPHHIRQGNIT